MLYKNGQKLGKIETNIPASIGTYTWKAGVYSSGVAPGGPGYQIKVNILNQPFMGMSGVFELKHKPLQIATEENQPGIKISPSMPLPELMDLEIGEITGRFYLCTVGSKCLSCSSGSPAVHEVPGKATRVFNVTITPLKEYFENDIWHGKFFLGKVRSNPKIANLNVQGSDQPPGSSVCNVGVSTSWTDQPGLIAGTLYCDSNMNNHLRILEIKKDPLCFKPSGIKIELR